MNDGVPTYSRLRDTVLPFIESCKIPGSIGRYRYSAAVEQETLYSSTYAAMTLSLLGELDNYSPDEKKGWADYLNSFQDDDGLYRDPVIYGQGWFRGDPLWCGRAHLTCHVVTALCCLGHVAPKPITFLDGYKNPDAMIKWLDGLDFGERVSWSGNEIMNIGTLLQYSRDFHADTAGGRAVSSLLEWLSYNHISSATGIWGSLDISNPLCLSHAVMAAYHWWPLFFYDKYPVPHPEAAIDSLLRTQNPNGGFGWGVHNPSDPYNSSACEDIDSIDPLVRMSRLTSYRRGDIALTLVHAKEHVLSNQAQDGGFMFCGEMDFQYGHEQLYGAANSGAMFPTWFRTLSLALLDSFFSSENDETPLYTFVRCPGFQFYM